MSGSDVRATTSMMGRAAGGYSCIRSSVARGQRRHRDGSRVRHRPVEYRDKSFVMPCSGRSAGVVSTGEGPWRIAMSTTTQRRIVPGLSGDHRVLMDRDRRTKSGRFRRRSALPVRGDITANIRWKRSRSSHGPPRGMLGLKHKGHLGPGADADITIYQPQRTCRRCSNCPVRDLSRRGAG